MKVWWIWLVVAWIAADAWLARWWWLSRRESRAEVHVRHAAGKYGVDPALVKAVAWRESRFKEDARGTAGELGLMQVGALAAAEWAGAERLSRFRHEDLLDPRSNTLAGTWYLARLLRRYPATDNPVAYALADYNAGRANVLRWIKGEASTNCSAFLAAIDFPMTRDYVESVLKRRDLYRQSFAPAANP